MSLSAMTFAAPPAADYTVNNAFLNGEKVDITFELAEGKKAANYSLGPWRFGAQVRTVKAGDPEKPQDKRLNAYIVVPGASHASPDESLAGFNHNLVINALPPEGKSAEYDVYLVLALDPTLHPDIRTERDILVATQSRFTPNDLYELEDAPSAEVLKSVLKMDDTTDLKRFRRKKNDDGTLPRMVIVPAGFALRASAPESVILPKPSSP